MLTQARLKQLLSYDPGTGLWTWLVTRGGALAGDIAGCKEGRGYIEIGIDGQSYKSSRLAWLWMTGAWPSDLIDHEDRNRTNDRWSNLRLATNSQNTANSSVRSSNSTGFKGVSIDRGRKFNPFRATIKVDGKREHLGYFGAPDDAHAAYCAAAKLRFGEYACAGDE